MVMYPTVPLRPALDRVYEIFDVYSCPTAWDASPLRDPVKLLQALTSVPLRRLDVDKLSGYAMWAMTTVGSVEAYKHFLPRILELSVETAVIEPEVIALKLQYGDWPNWAEQEKRAIADLLYEACAQAIGEHPNEYLAEPWFCAIAILELDLSHVIRLWQTTPSSNAALQLCQLLRGTTLFEAEVDERLYWANASGEALGQVRKWLLSEELRIKLTAARLSILVADAWILDQALETQAELIEAQLR
jgi:hypothetical protein